MGTSLPAEHQTRIKELCGKYNFNQQLQDRIVVAFGARSDTFEEDMDSMFHLMTQARVPPGLCSARLKEMDSGNFKVPDWQKKAKEKASSSWSSSDWKTKSWNDKDSNSSWTNSDWGNKSCERDGSKAATGTTVAFSFHISGLSLEKMTEDMKANISRSLVAKHAAIEEHDVTFMAPSVVETDGIVKFQANFTTTGAFSAPKVSELLAEVKAVANIDQALQSGKSIDDLSVAEDSLPVGETQLALEDSKATTPSAVGVQRARSRSRDRENTRGKRSPSRKRSRSKKRSPSRRKRSRSRKRSSSRRRSSSRKRARSSSRRRSRSTSRGRDRRR